jgi:ABC-type sulfate/molybdate transport systems ATPase subunit
MYQQGRHGSPHTTSRFTAERTRSSTRVSLAVTPGAGSASSARTAAGKTTLLRALAGLEEPDSGS